MPTPSGSDWAEPASVQAVPIAERRPFHRVLRYRLAGETAPRTGSPVLLVHAATMGHRMFLERDGGFVRYLLDQRGVPGAPFDVYTLDWRGSNLLVPDAPGPGGSHDDYRIDQVAGQDVPAAFDAIASLRPGVPIHVVAHCMGAASTAQALATGQIGAAGRPLGHLVLATIGLFYRLGVDGLLKTADNVPLALERSGVHSVSPHVVFGGGRWPGELENLFELWKSSVFPHGCNDPFCDRLWFMYGGDYRADDMMDLHDGVGILPAHFGAMPIGLYAHIAENCRVGRATPWRRRGDLLDPRPFAGRSVTLLGGSENQVWHRDALDRMYEWLVRELGVGARHVRKRILPRYGHVDLWWSRRAPAEVFPEILRTLTAPLP